MANGWLRLATDDFTAAAAELSEAAPAALRAGSYRVALYAFTWLTRTHFHLGAWDEAIVDADRAVTLLSETEHEWLRPLVHWVASAVPAARGDWATADQHAAAAASGNTAYEMMLLCGGMAKAQVAAAYGNHDAVLEALEPVLTLMPRQGIEEPGFWSWQHLYVDALTGTGRLDEAEAFLRPREELANRRRSPIIDGPARQIPGPPRICHRRHRRGDGRVRVRSSTTPAATPARSRRPSSNSPGDSRCGEPVNAGSRPSDSAVRPTSSAHWAPNRSSNAPNGNYWPAAWHQHAARITTPTGSPPTSWRSRTWSVKE